VQNAELLKVAAGFG